MAPERSLDRRQAGARGNSQHPRISALVPNETPLYVPDRLAVLLQDVCGLDRQRNVRAAVVLNVQHTRVNYADPDDPNVQQLTPGVTWARGSDRWWHKRLQRIWSPKSVRRALEDLQKLDLLQFRWHAGQRWWSINYEHLNELEQTHAANEKRQPLAPEQLLGGSRPRLLYPTLVRLFGGNSAGGTIRALLYAQIHFWNTHNRNHGKGWREGRTWSEQSVTNWLNHDFPFLKRDAVSDALKWLRANNYVTAQKFYLYKFRRNGRLYASQQLSYSLNPLLLQVMLSSQVGLSELVPTPSNGQGPTGHEPLIANGHEAVMSNGHDPSMFKETELINKKVEMEVDQGEGRFLVKSLHAPDYSPEDSTRTSEEKSNDIRLDGLDDSAIDAQGVIKSFGAADQLPAPASLDEGQLLAKRHRIANFRAELAAQIIRQTGGSNDDARRAAQFTLKTWMQMPDDKIVAYAEPEGSPDHCEDNLATTGFAQSE